METTKTKISWEFPKTNWGSESGKNDPGMETFRGNPYPALAREPIQNSLDASREPGKPVRVEFSVFKLPGEEFPGRTKYIEVLNQCINEAKDGSETKKEMEKALQVIESDEIYFMKISDFNTTGLEGSDELRNTDWHRLIKVVGDSDKEETSGGAFGIGKHAPFVCSDLKVVFYSTKDTEGKRAFQGVAKLITFMDKDSEPRQATGFYGEVDKIQPIKDMDSINDIFVREEIGTDLFIAGFDYRDTWKDEIIEAVISSFFIAIHENKLEVKVGGQLINQDSIGGHIERLREKGSKNNVINYYEVLTSEDKKKSEKDFKGLGRVELHVANKDTYHKKIAMARKTGMVIKEKQNYQIPNKYAGVLLIKGDGFNRELKRVENPTHTDWEFKRKKDVEVIKSAYDKLIKWMNDEIKSISPFEEAESFDVDELSQFLPDDNDEIQLDNEGESDEGQRGKPLESELEKVQSKRKKKAVKASDWDEDPDGLNARKKGKGEKPDSPIAKKRKKKQKKDQTDPPDVPVEKTQKAIVSQHALLCKDYENGIYCINLDVKKAGELTMRIDIQGEDSDVPALISSAKMTDQSLQANNEVIGPIKVSAGINEIEFELEEKVRVALGVTFNGN